MTSCIYLIGAAINLGLWQGGVYGEAGLYWAALWAVAAVVFAIKESA